MKPGVDPRPVPGVQYDFLDVNGRRKWRNNHGGNAGARVAAAGDDAVTLLGGAYAHGWMHWGRRGGYILC